MGSDLSVTHQPNDAPAGADSPTGNEESRRPRWTRFASGRMRDFVLPSVLLAQLALWTMLVPSFLTQTNLINIARTSSLIGIMAIGMTFVILTAGIDLSVGSLVSFVGLVCASTLAAGGGTVGVVVVGLGLGALAGLLNGTFVAKFGVPPLITTLGTMYIFVAAARLWNNGGPLPMGDPVIIWLGSGYVGPIPVPVIVLVIVLGVAYWILNQTTFGRHVYAVGGNSVAAKLAGVRTGRVLLGVYVVSGVLGALTSLLYAGRLATASPLTGDGLELEVIAAVVVGGASIFGGRGTLRDTILGVLILTTLQNGLNLVGVSGFWQTMALGIALLIAVLFSPGSTIRETFTSLFRSRKAS
ncbi:MAG: ABC transporter permease [Propionibacteriaceae bacterium]